LKKNFIYAEDFAKAEFKDIFSPEKIQQATALTADYFGNVLLINNGNLNFSTQALPWKAQLTSYRDAAIVDINNDTLPDIFLAGNYYSNNIHAGRNDADLGSLLVNKGKGQFVCENLNGVIVKGETRKVRQIKIGGQLAYILAKNSDSVRVITFTGDGK